MSYIPKQIRQVKDRVETKLDREIVEKLAQYCEYLESDRDYIIGQALEVAFKKDKGFLVWLKERPAIVEQVRN